MKKRSILSIVMFTFLIEMTIVNTMNAGSIAATVSTGKSPIELDKETREILVKNVSLMQKQYLGSNRNTEKNIEYAKTKEDPGWWIMLRVQQICGNHGDAITNFCELSKYVLFLAEEKIPLSEEKQKLIYKTIKELHAICSSPLYRQFYRSGEEIDYFDETNSLPEYPSLRV